MNSRTPLFVFVLLGATCVDVHAQSRPAPTPTPTEEVGRTGTDTATTPTGEDVGHTGTDTLTSEQSPPAEDVGHTGTDTLTGSQPTDDVGHTGTDTVVMSGRPSPWTLSATSSAISSPGSNTVTVTLLADPESGGAASYTVPLSSSAAACTLPASVALDWTPDAGGMASFQVDCAKVTRRTTVTITGGTASTSFTLKP